MQSDVAPNDPGQFILAKALAYIEQHLSTPMTIHDIARSAGTSERRLYVLFRQHLTKNPIHPYSDLAPESGHRPPSLPIIEIAHRAGYADQSALTHTLKKARNLAPVSLRKQARDH